MNAIRPAWFPADVLPTDATEMKCRQPHCQIRTNSVPAVKAEGLTTTADIGLTHKDIHEARLIRDAEAAEPRHRRRPHPFEAGYGTVLAIAD
jgi:hypothetical protein